MERPCLESQVGSSAVLRVTGPAPGPRGSSRPCRTAGRFKRTPSDPWTWVHLRVHTIQHKLRGSRRPGFVFTDVGRTGKVKWSNLRARMQVRNKSNTCPMHSAVLLQRLQVDQLGVAAVHLHQLGVRALLDDASLVEDVDDVGLLNGAEAMGDGNGGAALGGLVEGGLDDVLRLGIEGRRGLVQQQDLGVADEGAGDGDALLLAAGEQGALASDDGVEALGHRHDEVVDVGLAAGELDGLVRDLAVGAEDDVLPDGALVERGLLADEGDEGAVLVDVEGADLLAVDEDGAGEGVVEALEEGDGGGLAAAGGADEGDVLARADDEVEAAQDGLLGAGRVAEVDVAELEGAVDGVEAGALLGPGVDGGLAVEQHLELVGGLVGLAHVGGEGEDGPGGLGAEDDGGEADEELEHVVLAVGDEGAAVPEAEGEGQEHEGLGGGKEQAGLEDGDEAAALLDGEGGLVLADDVVLAGERGDGADGRDGLGRVARRVGVGRLGAALEVGEHPEAEEAAADEDRDGRGADERELPADGDGEGQGGDQGRRHHEQGAEGDAAEAGQVGCLGGQEGGERAGRVLVLVEEGDVLAQHGAEGLVAHAVDEPLGALGEDDALDDEGDELHAGEHEVHGAPEVRVLLHLVADGVRGGVGDRVRQGHDLLGEEDGLGGVAAAADDGEEEADEHELPLLLVEGGDELDQRPQAVLGLALLLPVLEGDARQGLGGGRALHLGRHVVLGVGDVALLGDAGLLADDLVVLGVDGLLLLGVQLVDAGNVLGGDEVVVGAVLREELVVGALFDDAAVGHDDDVVGVLDGRQAVGDGDGGAALGGDLEGGLHDALGLGVQRGGGLVEEENWVGNDGAGDGDALLLAAGEEEATLADVGHVALGEAGDEVVGVGHPRGVLDQLLLLLVGGALVLGADEAVPDVLVDGGGEEGGLLADEGHLLAEPAQVQGADVVAVEVDGAAHGVVEALDEADDGALAGAGGADQGGGLAGGDVQGHVLHDGDLGAGRVDVLDVLEADGALDGVELDAVVGGGVERGDAVDGVVDLGGGGDGRGEGLDVEGANHDGHHDDEDVGQGDAVLDEELAALPEGEAVVEVQDGHHEGDHDADGGLDLVAVQLGLGQVDVVLLGEAVLGAEGDGVADGADDLVGEAAAVGVRLDGLFAVLDDEGGAAAHAQEEGDDGGQQDQRELPVVDEADDEGRDEGGEGGEGEADLFGNAVLDQVGVGGDARRHLAGTQLVEEANVLAHAALEVVLADLGANVLSRVCVCLAGRDEADGAHVLAHEDADGEVDKVQDQAGHLAVEVVLGRLPVEVALKGALQVAEDDGHERQGGADDDGGEGGGGEDEEVVGRGVAVQGHDAGLDLGGEDLTLEDGGLVCGEVLVGVVVGVFGRDSLGVGLFEVVDRGVWVLGLARGVHLGRAAVRRRPVRVSLVGGGLLRRLGQVLGSPDGLVVLERHVGGFLDRRREEAGLVAPRASRGGEDVDFSKRDSEEAEDIVADGS
ncbi:hypothetical protein ColKHC_03869 [Colletotrichum higginsianum]|nr:hypothetical protein ColKHC_03869 [Colletotrichum higginsianum]